MSDDGIQPATADEVRPALDQGPPSTVGTGSAVAIGCTLVTAGVIALGVVILLLTRWL